MHRFMWTCTVMIILFAAFREALEQRLGAVQDSDMRELLTSVVKLRVSVTPPSAAAGMLCAAKVATQNDTITIPRERKVGIPGKEIAFLCNRSSHLQFRLIMVPTASVATA